MNIFEMWRWSSDLNPALNDLDSPSFENWWNFLTEDCFISLQPFGPCYNYQPIDFWDQELFHLWWSQVQPSACFGAEVLDDARWDRHCQRALVRHWLWQHKDVRNLWDCAGLILWTIKVPSRCSWQHVVQPQRENFMNAAVGIWLCKEVFEEHYSLGCWTKIEFTIYLSDCLCWHQAI